MLVLRSMILAAKSRGMQSLLLRADPSRFYGLVRWKQKWHCQGFLNKCLEPCSMLEHKGISGLDRCYASPARGQVEVWFGLLGINASATARVISRR